MVLSGCGLSNSPFWSTVGSFVPGRHGDIPGQAKAIRYATISLSLGGRGGLLVLAEQKDGLTFWTSGRAEVVVLNDGFLSSISGLAPRLEMSEHRNARGQRVSMDALGRNAKFVVERSWVDAKGAHHAGRAQAHWNCASETTSIELPLTTRDLYKCVETLDWAERGQTRSVYWRDDGGHVWKADVAAWPGAPAIKWDVARPWWPLS